MKRWGWRFRRGAGTAVGATFKRIHRRGDYPDPAQVRTVPENGGIRLQGRDYFVSRALIGERVQLQWLEDRVLVFFCNTVVREFDLHTGASYGIDYGQMDRVRAQGLWAGGS